MAELERCFFRVDPRLVHATVMNAWVPELRAAHMVIADGQVVADPRRRHILEMSAMEEVGISFAREADLASHLAALSPDRNILVLFSSLPSVELALEAGAVIDQLNVGHLPARSGAEAMHPAVYLGPEDARRLTALHEAGVRVFVQPLPHDPALSPVGIPRPVQVRRPGRVPSTPPTLVDAETDLVVRDLEVRNERGLHLRAAHVLAHHVARFAGDVRVGRHGHMVNAKSLLGLTTLGAARGTLLRVEVEGEGAETFMEGLDALFRGGFQEGTTE